MNATVEKAKQDTFPGPEARPGSDVVIYDGDCQFCTAQVRNLMKWDGRGHRLSCLSLHDPEVVRRWPHLTHDDLMKEMYLIRPDGKTFRGADAVRYLSLRLPRLWWLAPVLNFPFMMPVWRRCYRWIAKRRYRLNRHHTGADCGDSCSVHFGDK